MPKLKMPDDVPSGGLTLTTPSAPPPESPAAEKRPTLWSLKQPSPSKLMIEPEYHSAYQEYMRDNSPEAASALLGRLNPVIDESLRSYGGSESQTATARARAKKLTLEAVRRYDPARAKLRTHLLSHLRGLRRSVERSVSGVYVPEQWRLDSRRVDNETSDARDELGREPSDAEVADRLMIPVDRVRRARGVPGTLAASQFEGSQAGSGHDQKAWDGWVNGIYHDSNPIDQVILEHSYGLFGKPVLPANKIAEMVGLSGGAVSQRKARLQTQLDEYDTFFGRGR